jgi:cytoskeletal protein CcmA (bactofilin family)
VTGNIIAPRIAVDDGATFNGTIEMRDPAQKV